MTTSSCPAEEPKIPWNGRAGDAWVQAQAMLDRLFAPIEKMLVESIPADGAVDVLDIGCGTGATTLAIARRIGERGHVAGVDISRPMVAAARERAEREGSSVTFIHADAQAYPFEPASFDRIVSRFGVMFFDDPVQAFANLERAARPGAELQLFAWRSAVENPFMTTAERAAAPLLPNLPVRRPDAPGQFAFADRARVERILDESGWTAIDIRPVDFPCTLPERDLVPYFTQLGPVGLVLGEVDDATRARVIDTVRTAFDPFVHGSEVRFTAACWTVEARKAKA